MPKPRRQWVKRSAVVVVVAGLLVVGVLAINSYLDPFDDRTFDAAAWTAAEHESERGPMVRDAIRRIPRGTPKERVGELLGEPDEATSGYPPDRWGRRTKGYSRWVYGVGCWPGLSFFGFDHSSLEVHFDHDGRVVEAEITGG